MDIRRGVIHVVIGCDLYSLPWPITNHEHLLYHDDGDV